MTRQSRQSHRLTIAGVSTLLILTLAFAGFGLSAPQDSSPTMQDDGPEIIAVKFHADWCGSCKAMGPVFEELQAKYDQQPVLFVVFDQTREFNRRQSQYLADALDLEDVWDEHGGKTGFVLLIDAETKKVIERLGYEQSLKEMGASLMDAAKGDS